MVAKVPWWDRLNRRLLPYLGPPPLGPYDEEPLPPTQAKACPLCGRAMADHDVERRADRPTQLHCPS